MDISRISKLGKLFRKKKGLDLRPQSVYDLQKFRDTYLAAAARHHVSPPPCIDKMIYKAISTQKDITSMDFREERITDDQLLALVETLLEMPLVSSLDLRDNMITDRGVRGILELMRHQVVLVKGAPGSPPSSPTPSSHDILPDHTRFLTTVQLKGNDVSDALIQQIRQYTTVLTREDKRLEIQAVLVQIDYNESGGVDESELRVALKLCGGDEPTKKDLAYFSDQLNAMTWQSDGGFNARSCLENLLLAKFAKSPSKKDTAGMPPWDSLVQIRHAELVKPSGSLVGARAEPPPPKPNPPVVAETSPATDEPSSATSSPDARRRSSPNLKSLLHEPVVDAEEDTPVDADEVIHEEPVVDDRACVPFEDTLSEAEGEENVGGDAGDDEGGHPEPEDLAPPGQAVSDDEAADDVVEQEAEEAAEIDEEEAPSPAKSVALSLDDEPTDDPVDPDGDIVPTEAPSQVAAPEVEETVLDEVCLVDDVMLLKQTRTVAKLQHNELRTGLSLSKAFDSIDFVNVVALILSNNLLESAAFLKDMEPMRALRVLDLSNNQLAKVTATDMVGIRNVEVLDLSKNHLKCIGGIDHLTKLRALSFQGNAIRCAKNLECLDRLEILNLSHNAILVPQSLRLLSMNKHLTHLNIDDNPVVSQGKHRKNSAHILNIIPTLRSLGCIHLASLIVKDKKKPSPDGTAASTSPATSIFEYLDKPRPWVDSACDLLGLVCDSPQESPLSPVPKVSRTHQKMKDEQRSKAPSHHVAQKTPPPNPPKPAPAKSTTSFSSQQKKAIALSAPRPALPAPRGPSPVLCHPPRPTRITADVKVNVAAVPLTKNFLQPTKASLYNHAEQKLAREKAKAKKKKPPNALYKRLKRREEQLRHAVATSPVKLVLAETHILEVPPPAPTLAILDPTAKLMTSPPLDIRSSSPVKPGSLAVTSTDMFLAQIRLNEFITLVTEDHATAGTALDILLGLCERPGDMAKFTAYTANLESLDIFADVVIPSSTQAVLDTAALESTIQPLPIVALLSELKLLKQTLKTLVHHVTTASASLGSTELRSMCASIRGGQLGHLLPQSPTVPTKVDTLSIDRPPSAAPTSLDLLSPAHNPAVPPAQASSVDDDVFDLHGGDNEEDFLADAVDVLAVSNEPALSSAPSAGQEASKDANPTPQPPPDDSFDFEAPDERGLTGAVDAADVSFEEDEISSPAPLAAPTSVSDVDVSDGIEFDEDSEAAAAAPSPTAEDYDVDENEAEVAEPAAVDEDQVDADEDAVDSGDRQEFEEPEDLETSGQGVVDDDAEEEEEEVEEGEEHDEEEEEALTFGDWEQGFDEASNHHYWFNTVTEESSWTPPEGWPHPLDAPAATGDDECEEEEGEEAADDADEVDAEASAEHEGDAEMSLEARIAMALGGGSTSAGGTRDDDDDEFDFDDDALPDL